MAKKLESRTSLTEFAPLSPESKSQTFSIRNIFFRNRDKSASSEPKGSNSQRDKLESSSTSDNLYLSSDSVFSVEKRMILSSPERRGMSGILGKIMDNIVDKKKKGLQNYKDSDFKQYWMPDSNCRECYDCGDKFTTFRRRHHCRVCGQIFCWRCCSQEIPGDLIGYTDDLRVCSYCCKMVLSCVQSLDSTSQSDDDSLSFRESQQKKFRFDSHSESSPSPKQSVTSPARRKSSVIGFREEDFAKAKPYKSALDTLSCRERTQKIDGPIQDRPHLKQLMHKLLNSVQSVSLWKQEYKDHHTKVILGCDIVDWLVAHDATLSRSDAINIGQAFIDAQFLECIIPQQNFIDGNVFYKPLEQSHLDKPDENSNEIQESMEPLWVKEIQPSSSYIFKESGKDSSNTTLSPNTPRFSGSYSRLSSSSSMFYLDLDIKESKVSVFKSQHESEQSSSSKQEEQSVVNDSREDSDQDNVVFFNTKILGGFINNPESAHMPDDLDNSIMKSIISSRSWHHSHLREDNGEKDAFENLNAAYKVHEATLLNQLLSNEGLSLSWSEIILPIIHHVVDSVRPDVKNDSDDMDIRQYVQFKKIPGGSKSECSIVSGVVFTKSVAHKKMRQRIQSPTVLLLTSAISYQRIENKLCSLDPIIMQEYEYLKNIIGKLTVFKPDILLVEKTVSRLAQEMLLNLGITVALNVKLSVMERIARCTQAAIVSTVDAHLGRPQLGTCKKFKVKTYSIAGKSKTLMFFEGCPENLGCTILLRGGSANELKKVKQVVQFMLFVAYNWNLERSFLMDEFAFLPSLVSETMECEESLSTEAQPMDQTPAGDSATENAPMDINTAGDPGANLPKKSKSRVDELGRKLETESISDFSDPLHSYLQLENDVFQSDPCDLKVDELPPTNTFSKLLDDIILCASLNVKPSLPFLETEAGKKCELRKFFPADIYWSRHFEKENETQILHPIDTQTDLEDESISLKGLINSKNVEVLPTHPLTNFKITDVLDSSMEMQTLLADFRARGGTIKFLCPHEKAAKEKEKKQTSMHQTSRDHARTEISTNTGLCWEKKTDVLDPYNHQTLAVLFSSYSCASDNAPNYCVNPWVVKMEFYGSNDITLGGFLDRYCFRSSYICPSPTCVTPMTEHVRKFVHGTGCVHILLHELSTGVPVAENNILMWSWCHICTKATPVVSMSEDTWSFSFAKYLELRFYADSYKRRGKNELCQHSLHHDHYQYFAQNNLVAIFKYTPVLIWEVVFPAFIISVTDKAIPLASLVEQIKIIAMKGHGIHSDLLTTLFALRDEYCETTSEDFIEDMIDMLKLETLPFREKIEGIQLHLTSPTLETLQIKSADDLEYNKDICSYMWKIEDQITLLKFHIANVVQIWNNRIQEFISARKKEKLQAKPSSQSGRNSEGSFNMHEESAVKASSFSPDDQLMSSVGASVIDSKTSEPKRNFLISKMCPKVKSENTKKYVESFCKEKCRRFSSPARSLSFGSINDPSKYAFEFPKLKHAKSEPDYLVCHSDEFNNVFFQREGSLSSSDSCYAYGVTPGICAALKVSEAEDYDSYVVCHKDCVDERSASPVSRKHHERSKSETEAVFSHSSHGSKHTPEKQTSMDGKTEKRSVKTLLNQLKPASTFTPIENPFSNLEHLLLPVPQKIPVIVHEGEPSSIIAYALSTDDYEQKLQELKLNLSTMNISQKDSQTSSPLLKHRSNIKLQSENITRSDVHFSSDDTYDFSADSTDKSHLKPSSKTSNLHLEVQFSDNSTKFYCRVYYAEQFRKLRSLIFSEGEERFIRSLSHCVQWVARGGKSGSLFCKTHDDRFILKQMPRLELQSFMDLAPAYFQYLNKSYLEQKPTLLAKIVGIFRIGFKNTTTNAATKMDLLVMENLFYNRNITRKYDLKGSIRNRLVNTNGDQEEDIVLLDENLLKITCDNPFYVRPHSKTVLTLAISNDTQFLVDQSVMDYSLLVGLEEEKGQLVVGIIDYIRTFTWDKKVEMLIKSSGILGGHGKMPTVVSPELYKMRFCEAMDSYFLWIPDRWTGLGKGVDG
ncbi:1-phosphatidylinositol 3-phosphate 5-kinase-like [Argiope bruennichi]|uniref:1-phosphatidylinositol 3-phosphate 5-kinase-like n=1 Tax=Argiope bruennichi TaxID=94029 RepID=UPI00249518B3|nr:1-phosphatidylinositol 3-phosphate 5-kinase-like [Argiope bruennichi]